MIDKEYWEYHPEWREYALSKWDGGGRVQQIKDDSIQPFLDRATQAFLERNVPIRYVKTYINVMVHEDGDGYSEGYPHVHYPLDALTLVHYLDDVPTPLDIFGDIQTTIYPSPGLTVFMPNSLKHGVRKNNHGTRVCMIATALR